MRTCNSDMVRNLDMYGRNAHVANTVGPTTAWCKNLEFAHHYIHVDHREVELPGVTQTAAGFAMDKLCQPPGNSAAHTPPLPVLTLATIAELSVTINDYYPPPINRPISSATSRPRPARNHHRPLPNKSASSWTLYSSRSPTVSR